MTWLAGLHPGTLISLMLAGVLTVFTFRACDEHDARIRAEDREKQAKIVDSIKVDHWQQMYEAASARVDTQRIITQRTIEKAVPMIDTAFKYIHDTIKVAQALQEASGAIQACTDLLNRCSALQAQSTHVIDSLRNLLRSRDNEKVNLFAIPAPPRTSKGFQVGIGGCFGRRGSWTQPVATAPCGYFGYGYSFRFP